MVCSNLIFGLGHNLSKTAQNRLFDFKAPSYRSRFQKNNHTINIIGTTELNLYGHLRMLSLYVGSSDTIHACVLLYSVCAVVDPYLLSESNKFQSVD